jgi:hypothetical protein
VSPRTRATCEGSHGKRLRRVRATPPGAEFLHCHRVGRTSSNRRPSQPNGVGRRHARVTLPSATQGSAGSRRQSASAGREHAQSYAHAGLRLTQTVRSTNSRCEAFVRPRPVHSFRRQPIAKQRQYTYSHRVRSCERAHLQRRELALLRESIHSNRLIPIFMIM